MAKKKETKVDSVKAAVKALNEAAKHLESRYKETNNTEVFYSVKAAELKRIATRIEKQG